MYLFDDENLEHFKSLDYQRAEIFNHVLKI